MRDGGKVQLCALVEVQKKGFMPVQKLKPVEEPFFSYRTGGVQRRFLAMGNNFQYDYIIRCWNLPTLPAGVQYAVMPDGNQYRVESEPIFDQDAIDLTLTRLEEFFDVATE